MAAYGWGSSVSIGDWLRDRPRDFELFQAIRLLELDDSLEPVRFRSHVGWSIELGEVRKIQDRTAQRPRTLTATVMGLAGAIGPLPAAYSEQLLERLADGDEALLDFLDLFNERLLALLHGAARAPSFVSPREHRPSPARSRLGEAVAAIGGLFQGGARQMLGESFRPLLAYAGVLSQDVRPADGLAAILRGTFETRLQVDALRGAWRKLDEADWSRLGRCGQNQRLGGGEAMLGRRIWDPQGRIGVVLGPMSLSRFRELLPDRSGFWLLRECVDLYLGFDLDYEVDLLVRVELDRLREVETRLTRESRPRLGWTTRLPFRGASRKERPRGVTFRVRLRNTRLRYRRPSQPEDGGVGK